MLRSNTTPNSSGTASLVPSSFPSSVLPEATDGDHESSPSTTLVERLRRREAALMAVSFAAELFLTGDWREGAVEILGRFGVAADVSRVFIFENQVGPNGAPMCTLRYSWLASHAEQNENAPVGAQVSLAESWSAPLMQRLAQREVAGGNVDEMDSPAREYFLEQGIQSILTVPVMVENRWWGFIGFAETRAPRTWDASETETLRVAADLLGAAVGRGRKDLALRESEAELRAIFSAMHDVILVIDRDGRYVKIAPTAPNLLYRPPQELLGRTLNEVFEADSAQIFNSCVQAALNSGRMQRCEYKLTIGGREIWFVASVNRLSDDTVLWIARDVTERKEAERLLQQQSAAMSASMDGMAILDDGWRFVFVNESHSRIYGYDRAAELLGKSWEVLYTPEEVQRFHDEVIPKFDVEGQWRGHAVGKMRDGNLFRQEISLNRINGNGLICVVRDVSETFAAQESLRESEMLFRLLAETATDFIARQRPDGRFLYVSPSCENLLGFSQPELVNSSPFDLVHPEDRNYVQTAYDQVVSNAPVDLVTYRMRRKDGSYVWFETTSQLIQDEHGNSAEIHTVSRDITGRREAEEALRRAEAKYRSIFENAVEGIFQTTPDGNYMEANPSLARIYGYDSPEHLMNNITDISRQLYVDSRKRAEFLKEMYTKGAASNFEAQIYRRDGQVIWISENARAVRDADGEVIFFEGTVEDITKRKVAEEQLLHDALHDKLTGLANRALFMDRLSQAVARLKRHAECRFGVLFLDFDRFKNVNDSLGHMAGDQLLIGMAARLEACLRPGDTVARLGGDEFAILVEDIRDVSEATQVAERIQHEMGRPFRLEGQEVFSSASIGIAVSNGEYDRAEDVLRDADMAMYRAKAMGKARHEVFDAGMHTRAVALLQLETDLRWAIERQEFRLHYQPIVALDTGRIVGFEALVRWQHPERGLVSPAEFIPVAEETGWIVPIGEWVLTEACVQLAEWQKQFKLEPPLYVAVNLSGKQFSQPDLIERIEATLRDAGLSARSLKLEITESAIMEEAQIVTDRLLKLRALGVRLGLDDFGTGYSSLSYLHRFPLDTLKIDRSFVARMSEGGEHREIVRTIVALGKNLNMDVVAEGVEDPEQLIDLRSLDCAHGQGYFFAKPLKAEAAIALLAAQPQW